jgi:hypothetical protein
MDSGIKVMRSRTASIPLIVRTARSIVQSSAALQAVGGLTVLLVAVSLYMGMTARDRMNAAREQLQRTGIVVQNRPEIIRTPVSADEVRIRIGNVSSVYPATQFNIITDGSVTLSAEARGYSAWLAAIGYIRGISPADWRWTATTLCARSSQATRTEGQQPCPSTLHLQLKPEKFSIGQKN